MSYEPFSSLYNMIQPWAKRAPIPAIDNAIRDIARDFCFESKFRRDSVRTDVIAAQTYYDLSSYYPDEEIVIVQAAQYTDGSNCTWSLAPIQPEQANTNPPPGGTLPQAFWFEPSATIALWPTPQADVTDGLTVRVILQPTKTTTNLHESIIRQHDTTIAWGALARLLLRNDEPWSNPKMAAYYEEKYMRGRGKALTDAGFAWAQWNQASAVYRY